MGTQGALQGGSMANRFMNAIGASDLVRTICASAGIAGTVGTHGVSPEVDPGGVAERALPPGLGLEPDVDRPPPVEEDPRGAPKRGSAGGRRPVPQPDRAGRRPAPAPAPGLRRGAGAGDDAGGASRRLGDEDWCRSYADGYDELVERLGEHPVSHWAEICGVDADEIETVGASSRRPSRRCCGSGSAPSATSGRRSPTGRSPAYRRWPAPGAIAAAGSPTSRPRRPRRCRARCSTAPS